MARILFVCMGNICRSPMAEGAFVEALKAHPDQQHPLITEIVVDSAGTIGYHAGNPPDPRACATTRKNGFDITSQRSRKVVDRDFYNFDYIMAMDNDNFHDLLSRAPRDATAQVSLFLEFAENYDEQEVPDPYYGGDSGFDHCLNLVQDASHGLLAHIIAKHG